jgi:hypothetical protein
MGSGLVRLVNVNWRRDLEKIEIEAVFVSQPSGPHLEMRVE